MGTVDKYLSAIAQVTQDVPGFPSLMARVGSVLRLIAVADQAILDGMNNYPEQADVIYEMFMPLGNTSAIFDGFIDDVFRSHCDEIINRIGVGLHTNKIDLQLGTHAECLLCMYYASMVAPLNQDAYAMYFKLWQLALGDIPAFINADPLTAPRETWHGAVDTEIAQLRRRIARLRTIEYPSAEAVTKRKRVIPPLTVEKLQTIQFSFLKE